MQTPEEVRRATQALMQEAEQLSAQSRQQRMLLTCLSVNLLKLHARLKQHGRGTDKLPHLLAAHGLLPSPPPQPSFHNAPRKGTALQAALYGPSPHRTQKLTQEPLSLLPVPQGTQQEASLTK